MELFPRWAALLDLDADIVGRDLPVGAAPDAVRAAVEEIGADKAVRGALVTTHKVDVYEYAADAFAELDKYARLCREVSCISKRDGVLVGHAKDPITSGHAMESMLGRGYWRERDAHALCLGGGGAGTAITVRLLLESPAPTKIIVAERSGARLDALRSIHEELRAQPDVRYETVSGEHDCDALLAALPQGSLIVNATGMGKDLPGSPISDVAVFPRDAVVWELNYRGELAFLAQARRQAASRALHVHDGWRYFLHGWTEVIAEVFDLQLDARLFAELAAAAEPFRPAA
jgi:shikimate dehydrogenase